VTGNIAAASIYLPQQNGLPYQGGVWGGLNGTKVTGPIENAWVALSDLQNGDTAVYVGQANSDGSFSINGVPDGNYLFTWWDEKLHYILDWTQITVSNGQTYDMGTQMLTGWFTKIEGYVFNDLNKNGVKDAGEAGIANYLVGLRDRDNSEIDRMSVAVTTDPTGYYVFERAYPMGSWMVLEAYNDTYYTTGITYQVENQPTPTTVLGDGVDVGVLPILGQGGRLDWGVHKYEEGTNGGIVGSVFYEVTRNEFVPQYEAVEPWSVGIPGLTMNLYDTVPCETNPGAPCDPSGFFEIDADGSLKKGALLDTTTTEVWEQPVDCTARDANGVPLPFPDVQEVLAPYSGGYRCLEGPLMGTQFQSGFAALDGNWGFTGVVAGDYLVEVVIPEDDFGRPEYQLTSEETVNVFGGDQFVPAVPPPSCAGPLHTVDVAGVGTDGYEAVDLGNGVIVPASTPVENPSFAAEGGSPFEGLQKPLCDTKLVTLNSGKSIAPVFTLFTDVPIPGKWKGYIIDDLSLSFDKTSLTFGEKAGLANAPIGVYDFNNRLVTTLTSDYNGTYEVLLPSTHSVNCPSPSGVCASMYYILGNDPGQPGQLNPNYNPQYRTIGASFEIWSGQMLPSDLAPTQMVIGVLTPESTQSAPADCSLPDAVPQLFAVSQPYLEVSGGQGGSFMIEGLGFGASPGMVTLDDLHLTINSWSDNMIDVSVPAGTPTGRYQLTITNAAGESTVNGLTFHVIGPGYKPDIYEVGPGRAYATIQEAIDIASMGHRNRSSMVVVYPDNPEQWTPNGAYYENLIMHAPVMLQGVGPGGVDANGGAVLGSVIDGRGVAGDTDYAENWRLFVQTLNWDGNQNVYEGAVIYILAEDGEFGGNRQASIDGLTIQGGDQQGFPNNLTPIPGLKEAIAVQGGGIFANAFARNLQITNNVLQSNGGAYGGAIRLGTPHLPDVLNDNQNDNVRIAHNRIHSNGGTNLAGAIGIFSGAEGYEVSYNDICGNFSAEYGGGISHYGLSPNGAIHHNRVYFNRAYDEGGGIMIAGELPANPDANYGAFDGPKGAGPVDVYANLIQANLGNDDGGGLRFLMAGNFPYNVFNNMIVNNISTHEGGGVSLNDAPDVRFYNNTVMKNITTATAVTSNGSPAPAGLSSSANSYNLQATLGGTPFAAYSFSNPLMFNNIFWDNRAGTWTGGGIAGIGQPGSGPIYHWDLGVSDGTGFLAPTNSLLQVTTGTIGSASNVVGSDPMVKEAFDVNVQVLPWRGNANFIDTLIVALETRVDLLGDFHLQAISPAIDMGAASKSGINAPLLDIDGDARPQDIEYDAGADEFEGAAPDDLPTVNIVYPTGTDAVSGSITIQVDAADAQAIDTVTVSIDTGTPAEIFIGVSGYYELVWDTTLEDNGLHTILALATDSIGQTAQDSVDVVVDNIDDPPQVGIVRPVEGERLFKLDPVIEPVLIQVSAVDDLDPTGTLTVEVSIDGGAWLPAEWQAGLGVYEYKWLTNPTDNGVPYTIDARATDFALNEGNAAPVNIIVDHFNDAPIVSIVNPIANATLTGDVLVQVSATDDFDAGDNLTVELAFTDVPTNTTTMVTAVWNAESEFYEFVWVLPVTTGVVEYTVEAWATDTGEPTFPPDPLTSLVDSITIFVDNVDDPPIVNIASPTSGSTISGSFIIQVDASDDFDAPGTLTTEVSVDGGTTWLPTSWNGTSGFYEYTWNTLVSGNGTYTIDAQATDSGANVGSASPVSVTVENGTGCATDCLRVSEIILSTQPQGNNASVSATVLVVDENGLPVPEAVVDITWLRPNLSIRLDSEAADGEGIASFNVNGPAGTYTFTVNAITLAGYTFDPVNSVPLSEEISTQ
jgi:hypothetical protein